MQKLPPDLTVLISGEEYYEADAPSVRSLFRKVDVLPVHGGITSTYWYDLKLKDATPAQAVVL